MRQTQQSPEGPRHLHRIPRLSEAPLSSERRKFTLLEPVNCPRSIPHGGRRARWGAGGSEPPAVSRACSRALSLPVLLSGDVRCPGLRPPRPTSSSQEDPRAPPACDPRPEALQTVSGGGLGVCLVCSSVGNHCPVPTHVWNVCWVGAESSPHCVLSVEADVLLRGCRSAAILLVRGEET